MDGEYRCCCRGVRGRMGCDFRVSLEGGLANWCMYDSTGGAVVVRVVMTATGRQLSHNREASRNSWTMETSTLQCDKKR